MGRSDQGIVMHWASSHFFGWPLQYVGYGGTGKQVRDILHVADLADLVDHQICRIDEISGGTFNVGGGTAISISLLELTELCAEATGRRVPITSLPETRTADVPLYLSDTRRVQEQLGWTPARSVWNIVSDSVRWLRAHQQHLLEVFDASGERRRSLSSET
jgi:CDP-paratose 2-epimerase